jgi:predicted nuclease of predicted toxin-antitoxin system
MKIKLDENIPATLSRVLSQFDHDVDTVPLEGCGGADDFRIWTLAQETGAFLITQDLDFSDLWRFMPGTHHGILLVRLNAPSRKALIKQIKSIFQTEDVSSWRRCFVVVTENKIRIRAPRKPKKKRAAAQK